MIAYSKLELKIKKKIGIEAIIPYMGYSKLTYLVTFWNMELGSHIPKYYRGFGFIHDN